MGHDDSRGGHSSCIFGRDEFDISYPERTDSPAPPWSKGNCFMKFFEFAGESLHFACARGQKKRWDGGNSWRSKRRDPPRGQKITIIVFRRYGCVCPSVGVRWFSTSVKGTRAFESPFVKLGTIHSQVLLSGETKGEKGKTHAECS